MKNFKFDFIAGISVFLVAIPLCLGIALACGAPMLSGLIAGIIGGVVIGILSDSHLSVSGPAAGLVAIVIVGISDLGSFAAFGAALTLAGLIQIILGLVKAGKLTRFLPHCVIEGMMTAIGIILILKQFPLLIGRKNGISFDLLILSISAFSLFTLVIWDKYFSHRYKLIPGSLITVLSGVILLVILQLSFFTFTIDPSYFVQIPSVSSFHELKSHLSFPDFSVLTQNMLVYKTAIVLALVASIESLLCVNAVERLDPEGRQTNKNRELLAQGTGNLISGLIGGLPITSVIVRSSVNLNAGAKSKNSAIIHGIFILIVLLVGAKIMNFVPLVSLASILAFTGYKLAHPKHLWVAWKRGLIEFIAFISTTIIVVVDDLLVGVISGIIIYYVLNYLDKKFQLFK